MLLITAVNAVPDPNHILIPVLDSLRTPHQSPPPSPPLPQASRDHVSKVSISAYVIFTILAFILSSSNSEMNLISDKSFAPQGIFQLKFLMRESGPPPQHPYYIFFTFFLFSLMLYSVWYHYCGTPFHFCHLYSLCC